MIHYYGIRGCERKLKSVLANTQFCTIEELLTQENRLK